MPPGWDRVLAREREHLDQAREFLRLMREDVLALPALAGDWVSREYLASGLSLRARELADLPDAPLFFGRIDYAAGAAAGASAALAGEHFHIGRRHVHDRAGRPVVIDWRAPVARPFYQATRDKPMGVGRRRRFGFAGGELTAYEDEGLLAAGPSPGRGGPAGAGLSRIVIEEIERPRSGPMRDIVATIQPDQDDIVRQDADRTVCVQGAPGTGKTAVGLHRVAYLLYAHRERMTRGGVVVIGPGREFLGYIRGVLPALGEFGVTQVSVDDLVARVPVGAQDPPAVAQIKGDVRMAEVLRRALWGQVAEPADGVVITRGSRRWRLPAAEIARLVAGLRERGVRYAAGRDMLSHRIAHVALTRMEAAGETCDDRTHEAVRRSSPVRAAVQEIWPKTDPVRLVFRLLAEPDLLASAAAGVLSPDEQAMISWSPPARGPASARWSLQGRGRRAHRCRDLRRSRAERTARLFGRDRRRGGHRGDRPGAGARRHPVRDRRLRRGGGPAARAACRPGQGPGVRLRDRGRARPDRRHGGARPVPPLCRPDPGGVGTDGGALRAAPGSAPGPLRRGRGQVPLTREPKAPARHAGGAILAIYVADAGRRGHAGVNHSTLL
jgi:hypothetical protein